MAEFGFEPAKAVAHLQAADPALARIIEQAGPFAMELKKARSVFAALAEAIVYQQLSNKAAATIFGRVCGHFPRGSTGLTPERLLALSDTRIRGAGISRPKLKSLRDLARRTAAGEVPTLAAARRMEDAEIVEQHRDGDDDRTNAVTRCPCSTAWLVNCRPVPPVAPRIRRRMMRSSVRGQLMVLVPCLPQSVAL